MPFFRFGFPPARGPPAAPLLAAALTSNGQDAADPDGLGPLQNELLCKICENLSSSDLEELDGLISLVIDEDAMYAKRPAARVLESAARGARRIDGAATACLLRFDASSGRLSAYNLGDSGFMLFSPPAPSRLAARSTPQSHAGNGAPYQLVGGSRAAYSDPASAGVASSFALTEGMVVLAHTDGLTDITDNQQE